jgi:hypothetical protein
MAAHSLLEGSMDRSIAIFAALSLFTALILAASTATAEIYRWDDENGDRHLVGDINEVPEHFREAALADNAQRNSKNHQINIIDAKKAPSDTGQRQRGPAAASASPPQQAANPMPGGQPEMWWRQTALQLERNISAAKSALSRAQAAQEDDDNVTISGRGARARSGNTAGRGSRGRAPRGRAGSNNSSSSDYTEYSEQQDVDQLEVAVEDAEREYDDFHDQARRAEVPNGWLRR